LSSFIGPRHISFNKITKCILYALVLIDCVIGPDMDAGVWVKKARDKNKRIEKLEGGCI
jgi:hypothetical protein